jgi:hypothetical protein
MKLRRDPRREHRPTEPHHEGMASTDKVGVEALGAAVAVIIVVLVVFWILTRIVF